MSEDIDSDTLDKLSRWLHEWSLDQKLRELEEHDEAGEISGDSDLIEREVSPFDPDVAVGHVRLLSRALVSASSSRPVYLAILSKWKQDRFLVAPYSPFSEPANNGEYLTLSEDLALKVLCPWAACSVSAERLRRSWLIGNLAEEEIKDALSLWVSYSIGQYPDPRLSSRTGPVISQGDDVRHQYMAEQASLLSPLQSDEDSLPKDNVISFSLFEESAVSNDSELLLAAASDEKTANQAIYEVEGYPLRLIVQFVLRDNQILFTLQSVDSGELEEAEGYSIVLQSGRGETVKLSGGQVVVGVDASSIDFILEGPGGDSLKLQSPKD